MTSRTKFLGFLVLVLLTGNVLAQTASSSGLPPLIPREKFFDNPEKTNARISPDATRLSYLAPEGGKLNVHVRTIGKNDDRAVTHDHIRPVVRYSWSRDGNYILYQQDQGGNENFRIYRIDLSQPDEPAKDLTPFEKVRVEIIALPRETPESIVIGMNKRVPELFDAYRLNLRTGEMAMVAENPGNFGDLFTDTHGLVRAATVETADGGREIVARDSESAPWRSIAKYANEEHPEVYGFTPDGRALYLGSAKGSDLRRLVTLDLASGKETVMDSDPEADLDNVRISDKTHKLFVANYLRDRLVRHVFDPDFKKDAAALDKVHSGDWWITSANADEDKLVVAYDDDVDPGATYLYDRKTGKAEFLFRPRPWLKPDELAHMQPVRFTSRDGKTVHGYLTTPRGIPAKKLPMVLDVHGGPWGRDTWGYDSEAQFLANRGYAVLQVNYRGSTGYGKSFEHAAEHEFAGKMHDDLIDGVNWAIHQGTADPKRVCIYGGSYGGYATLVGMTFTPDVFACGVDYVGPSSLITLIKSFPPYWKPYLQGTWYRYVGDPDDPKAVEDMKARSPLYHVDKIKAPLLVFQGANDPRVTKLESDQMVEALRKSGREVDYFVADNEGHGFMNPDNRLKLYARMEMFLAKYIGGRAQQETPASPAAK